MSDVGGGMARERVGLLGSGVIEIDCYHVTGVGISVESLV